MGVYENLVFSKNRMTGHSLGALTFILDWIRFLSDPLRGHIDISLSIFCSGWEQGELYCQQENFIFVFVNSLFGEDSILGTSLCAFIDLDPTAEHSVSVPVENSLPLCFPNGRTTGLPPITIANLLIFKGKDNPGGMFSITLPVLIIPFILQTLWLNSPLHNSCNTVLLSQENNILFSFLYYDSAPSYNVGGGGFPTPPSNSRTPAVCPIIQF